jgi:mono/diheme cytochrome c family protein
MLPADQFRQLITAVYGLITLVFALFGLVALLAFLQPTTNNQSAPVEQTTNAASTPTPVVAALTTNQEHGKSLFASNCAQCHTTTDEVLVGPGLKGVQKRAPGEDWLKKWIRNSSALVGAGDPYAVQIFNKFQKIPMTSFTSLSDEDITDILDYIGTAK